MVKVAALVLLATLWPASVHAVVTQKPESGAFRALPLAEGYDVIDDVGDGNRGDEMTEFNHDTGEFKRTLEAGNNVLGVEGEKEVDGKWKTTFPLSLILKQLSELKEAVNGLKTQNTIIYKQMKAYQKTCSAAGAATSSSLASSFLGAASAARPEAISSIHNAILSDALRLNPVPKTLCHEEFIFYPEYNGCYKLTADRVTWRIARERCLAQNSDLVSVESSRKQRFLIERAKSSPETRHCDFWIGLSRHSSSLTSWKWSVNDETPIYTNWNFNEPNNGKGNEQCVQMLWIFHWKWNDAACNYGNACYICQTKPYA